MTTLEQLQKVTCRLSNRIHLHKPWPVMLGSDPWTVATDGHRVLAVAGLLTEEPKHEKAPNVAGTLELPSPVATAATDVLRAWAGEGSSLQPCDCGGKPVKCDDCDGKKTVECRCNCGDYHTADCENCDGEGAFDCDACTGGFCRIPPVTGQLLGVRFDRTLFRDLLDSAPPELHVGWSDTEARDVDAGAITALALWGEGWRAMVMPLRGEVEEGDGESPIVAASVEVSR